MLLHCPADREDLLAAELYELGTCGVVDEPGGARAFFESSVDRGELATKLGGYSPEFRDEPETDWEQVARDAWPPVAVGGRLYLAPPWSEAPTPRGRLRLEINPGMACGTGWHACTQLCLEALEQYLRPGDRVLDVGSGSGILSEAARVLGAGTVIGCDIDFEAVRVARERIGCPAFAGSVEAVRAGSMDLIVANISSAAIEQLADELARVAAPGSTLVLSGFQEGDRIEGFPVTRWLRKGEWLCAVTRSEAALPRD